MMDEYSFLSGDPKTDHAIWNLAHAIWNLVQVFQQIQQPQNMLSISSSEFKNEAISQEKLLLKPAEVAELLSISKNMLYELVKQKQIPSIRFGKSIRISRKALEQCKFEHLSP